MKNKLIIITVILFAFVLINIFSLKDFYYNFNGKKLYNKELYNESIEYFSNSSNVLGVYNKANALYKQKKYKDSIIEYKSIIGTKDNRLLFAINHNIGNIFYRLGELEKNNKLKIRNWEESVKYYSYALNIVYNEETKKNLEFVLNKLKQEKNNKSEQKDKKENNSKNNKNNKNNKGGNSDEGSNKDKNKQNDKGTNEAKKGEKGGNQTKKDGKNSEKLGSNKKNQKANDQKNGKNKLSKSQEQALKKYQEALKKEEQKNQNNFNKVYKENNTNDPFSNFFNDPFFNNDLLNNGTQKKDW